MPARVAGCYLVKTERVCGGKMVSRIDDGSGQSLSHRSECIPRMLLASAVVACRHALDRRPRCLIIIKQGSQRRLHSEHGGAKNGSVKEAEHRR